jgi:hypothetical protein
MNFERFHSPAFSEAFASGMCRASASIRPIVCSAAEIVFPSGALTTMTPRSVAAFRSMLSTRRPRPRPQPLRRREHLSAVTRVAADDQRHVADRRDQLVGFTRRDVHLRLRCGMAMPSAAIGSATRCDGALLLWCRRIIDAALATVFGDQAVGWSFGPPPVARLVPQHRFAAFPSARKTPGDGARPVPAAIPMNPVTASPPPAETRRAAAPA